MQDMNHPFVQHGCGALQSLSRKKQHMWGLVPSMLSAIHYGFWSVPLLDEQEVPGSYYKSQYHEHYLEVIRALTTHLMQTIL